MEPRARHRAYFVVMGLCVVLIVLAWNLVRLWSVPAAVGMSIVAALLPPVASIIGNTGALDAAERTRDSERCAVRRGPDQDG